MKRRTKLLLAAPLVVSQAVVAQIRPLEEVTVTARKKTESLLDVPIAISVISGQDIQEQGLTSLQAVIADMPAVNVNQAGGGAAVNIRGIGSGENPGFEQSVGFVIDEVPVGRSRSMKSGLFDLASIEVLKGPQTTYFGANTIAGVINVRTNAPALGDELSGYIVGSYEEETNEVSAEGAIDTSVTDTLAVRVAAKYTDSDGYIDNPFLKNTVPATKDNLIRMTALWSPNDDFDATVRYQYSEYKANAALLIQAMFCIPGGPAQGNCLGPDGNPIDTNFNYTRSVDLPGEYRKLDMDSASAVLNYRFGDWTIKSVTGWYTFDHAFLLDLDVTDVPLDRDYSPSRFSVNQRDNADGFSQELRVTSPQDGDFFWEAGLFYQDENAFFSNIAAPAFAAPIVSGARSKQNAETWSAFGAATYNITDLLTATVGVRYIEVEKHIRQSPDVPGPLPADGIPNASNYEPFGGFSFETDSLSDNDTLPSIELAWMATDEINTYLSYREGFKAGGYSLSNPPQGETSDYIESFAPETVKAWEAGSKGRFLDGRLSLNAAVFYMEYDDRQVTVLANSASLTQIVENAATSTSRGVELDFAAQLTDRLSVRGAFSYLDSAFDGFPNAACYTGQTPAQGCIDGKQDLSGHDTTFAPEYSGSLTAAYTLPVGQYKLTIQPNVYYTDSYWTIANFYPDSLQDSFVRYNLRVALSPEDEDWELAFVGRNLNNKKTRSFCQGGPASPGNVFCSIDPPATYMVQARYNF